MNSDSIAPLSVPNPKRTAIFDFLDSEHESTSPIQPDFSSSDAFHNNTNYAKALTPENPSDFNLSLHSSRRQNISTHDIATNWNTNDMLGIKSPSTFSARLPTLPSLSSLASPWAPQSTTSENNFDLSFDPSANRTKSGFGGMLTSSVGLDLQWPLSGSEPAVPLPGSRATSAIGILAQDVPLNTPQPISRPISTRPLSDNLPSASLLSLLNNESTFQRTVTPPVPPAGARSISPRFPNGDPLGSTFNQSEDSRWPKPVRFSLNYSNPHRSTLLDTPNHGSSQHLDNLLINASSTTPTITKSISSTSLFSADPSNVQVDNTSTIIGRPGRDTIGSPFASQNLSVPQTQTELPFEALEQYRQSRESTPLIPTLSSNTHRKHHQSPPPYQSPLNIHGHNHSIQQLHQQHHQHHLPHHQVYLNHQHQPHSTQHGHVPHASGHHPHSSRGPPPPQTHHSHHPSQHSSSSAQNSSGQNKSGFSSLDDRAIENVIVNNCYQILVDAAEHMLKAVELANTLRARVGTEVLAQVRERWGGLLSLLEKHKDRFLVERIPKNDRVRLLDTSAASAAIDTSTGSVVAELVNELTEVGGTKVAVENADTCGEIANENLIAHQIHDATTEIRQSNSHLDGGEMAEIANSNSHQQNHTASRCLHVGNVPNTYTDAQLTKEFERFGIIEGLKLINQKNGQRRFAFITFQSIEHAIAARHALSKVHPWKSAISFAHKDLLRNNLSSGGAPSAATGSMSNTTSYSHGAHMNQYAGRNPSSSYQSASPHIHHTTDYDSHQHPSSTINTNTPNTTRNGWSTGSGIHPNNRHLATMQNMIHRTSSPIMMRVGFDSVAIANTPSYEGGIEATTGQTRERIIVQRLCDDTYVPTQPWPVDREADMIVGQSIIDQILQFGGNTTISKLRGFLKHRMGTVDNIKSVPLKAMLLAYPQFFHVEGNYVSLVNHSCMIPSSSTAISSTDVAQKEESSIAANIGTDEEVS